MDKLFTTLIPSALKALQPLVLLLLITCMWGFHSYIPYSFKICPRNIMVFKAIFSQMVHTTPQEICYTAQSFVRKLPSPLSLPVTSL